MNLTSFEKGQVHAWRAILHEILEARFGSLSPEVLRRVDELPVEQLQSMCKAALRAGSLAELGLEG